MVCRRIVPNPSQHQGSPNGGTCVDLSGLTLPLLQDVAADVARDLQKAMAIANAMRAGRQVLQRTSSALESNQYPGMAPSEQQWDGAGNSSTGFDRPGGSASMLGFTTASQIRQWAMGDARLSGSVPCWPQGQTAVQHGPAWPDSGWQQIQGSGQQSGDDGTNYGAGPGMFF